MSSIKISQLTEKATMDGSEELLINDSGTSKKMTTQPILDAQAAAETAQTAAETAQTGAETAETNAASSASAASTSASNASTSASNAASSESAAASSASAAQAAEDAALAALDNFDDRYLGVKTSDPTVDNDGDALVAGALYYNSTDDVMKVYEGSSWVAAYASLSGTLVASNNLSDLTNASAARTNLGLGTAATTASTDYATAAQGTTADSALQNVLEDTTPQLGGNLQTNGYNIRFGDSATPNTDDTLTFGASHDLKIYHDGSNSYITDDGTGNLLIRGANVEITTAGGNKYFEGASNVAKLFHTSNEKLATTTTGIDVTGTINADGLTLGDNESAYFGASNDLRIFHNGSHSYIQDVGTGNVILSGSSSIKLQGANGEDCLVANENADVKLYYDNSAKLATTSTGVDVTGTVTSDGLTVEPSGTRKIKTQLATSGSGFGAITCVEPSADNLRGIALEGEFLQLNTAAYNQTAAKQRLRISDGGDISFYEDTGTTAKLFWDASAERLGIGTTSPTAKLQVKDSTSPYIHITADGSTTNAGLYIDSSSAYDGSIVFLDAGTSTYNLFKDGSQSDDFRMLSYRDTAGATDILRYSINGDLRFSTAATERMRIDSSGNVGIGTTAPSYPLDIYVSGANANLGIQSHNSTPGSYNQASLRFSLSSSSSSTLNWDVNAEQTGLTFDYEGSEKMRIDSNGNVGIGTSSPDKSLHIAASGGGAQLKIQRSNTNTTGSVGSIGFANSDGNFLSAIESVGDGDNVGAHLIFRTHSDAASTDDEAYEVTERMRLTSGGTLLVGTTDSAVWNNSTGEGVVIEPDAIQIARSGNPGLLVNRQSSDGEIARFLKDGTTVGSIGTNSGQPYFINSSNKGIRLYTSGVAAAGASGAFEDAAQDLGASSVRWRHLYLSGNVNVSAGSHIGDSNDYITWSNNAHMACVVNGGERVRIESDGDLHADGDVIAYSTTISDERLKENIQPIDDALAKVKQLKGCTFTYTADGKESAGLIAQDVEKVLPSAVTEKELPLKQDDGKEYKVLQYDQTIGLLVEAIKELSAKVEELENK